MQVQFVLRRGRISLRNAIIEEKRKGDRGSTIGSPRNGDRALPDRGLPDITRVGDRGVFN